MKARYKLNIKKVRHSVGVTQLVATRNNLCRVGVRTQNTWVTIK